MQKSWQNKEKRKNTLNSNSTIYVNTNIPSFSHQNSTEFSVFVLLRGGGGGGGGSGSDSSNGVNDLFRKRNRETKEHQQ